ncbi:MAG: cytochrome c-type biogenesis protein CcmH [Thermoanaerobaculia bacterium]|nr:cytochrome c-type biogenesis protein CcmH [Thermoanaerobaculia bacterium]
MNRVAQLARGTVLSAALLLALFSLAPRVAGAQDGAPLGPPLSGAALERATEEVSSLMRCPVCQGLSVADSPASSAVDLKAEVRRQIALGYTKDQVIASFERSYGEFIRLEPKAEGFNWLVWLAPMLALGAGALVIFFRLRPAGRPPAPAAPAAVPTPHEESKSS